MGIGLPGRSITGIHRHFARLHQASLQDFIAIHEGNGVFIVGSLVSCRVDDFTRHRGIANFRRPTVEHISHGARRVHKRRVLFRDESAYFRTVFVFASSDNLTTIVDKRNLVLVLDCIELGDILGFTRHFGNFGIPAGKRVSEFGIPFLGRGSTLVFRRRTVLPIGLFQSAIHVERHLVRTEFRSPHHFVRGVLGRRSQFRSELIIEFVAILCGRHFPLIPARLAFRNFAFGNQLCFHQLTIVVERDFVERNICTTNVVDFKGSRFRMAGHLPFNGGRLFQDVLDVGRNRGFITGLFQLFKYNRRLGPIFSIGHYLLVILITDIDSGLHPEIMGSALVIVTDDLARRKIPRPLFSNIHHKAGVSIGQIAPIQHKGQLEVLGIIPFNNVVRQIRSATFVGVRIVRERATPIRHEITVFEIFDQHGLALGNLEYGSLVKNRLIRGIFGSFYNFRFPADKEVIVFLVRFLLRSFARVFRHFSFAHFHLLQESRTVHEGNIVSFLHLALHVVNLQRSLVTITIGNEPVKAVNRFFNIFY